MSKYQVCHFKLSRINQDLARIQRAYNDARIGGSSEVLELITQRMETEMTKYIYTYISPIYSIYNIHIFLIFLSHLYRNGVSPYRYLTLKASLLVPEMLEHLAKFHAMTAFWLVQVNLHVAIEEQSKESFIPKQYIPLTFPLPEAVPITLRYVTYALQFRIEYL